MYDSHKESQGPNGNMSITIASMLWRTPVSLGNAITGANKVKIQAHVGKKISLTKNLLFKSSKMGFDARCW